MKRSLVVVVVVLAAAVTAGAQEPTVAVVVDADRGALVRWPLPAAGYPAGGFQIERSVDGAAPRTVATVTPGEAGARLDPAKKEFADRYLAAARAATPRPAGEANEARLAAELVALGDPAVAAYLGLSFEDRDLGAGRTVTYTIRALGADGRPLRVHGVSPPTPIVVLPPPPPPADFRGVAARDGIALYWSPPAEGERNPAAAVTYEVKKRSGRAWAPLTPEPVLRIASQPGEGEPPGVIDPAPAPEQTAAYAITAIDLFGRRGPESAPIEVFFPDWSALDPPETVAAISREGKAVLTWEAPANRNRKGWTIVRALQPEAAGEALTPKPIAASSFTDGGVAVGTTYYYRIAAVNARGEEGEPRVSGAVRILSGRPPAPPTDLTAELKTGRVILSWTPSRDEVAGYQVERSTASGGWGLLTDVVTAEPRFEDVYPQEATGTFRYRVTAWARDDTPSAPSEVLTVPLPDTAPPLAPIVTAIDGSGGKVTIRLSPRGGVGDATAFYVLRSESPREVGTIQNPDEPIGAGDSAWVDRSVEAGRTYFYRLVSVDAAGNRSEPTFPPSVVRVGAPPLPAPPEPRAHFETRPFPRVVVDFPASGDASVFYALERRDPNGRWVVIQGPFPAETTSVIDASPPRNGTAVYRLVSVGADGSPGPRSGAVEVAIAPE